MLLGDRLPGAYTDWRVVEADLHDIAGRVREYDSLARLVRNDETGQLGLARWQDNHYLIRGGALAFARAMHDLETDAPLTGAPDERCMRFMRAADSRRLRSMREWYRRSRDASYRRESEVEEASYEENHPHAERIVHAMRKDTSVNPFAFFPDRKKAA